MTVRILNCDVLAGLAQLDDESVHCVVTSPPYWGLRDYGVDGQIGLEATPEAFVARMVEVFRDVRRVLRKDGTCWVNLGDSYCARPRGSDNGWDKSRLTNPAGVQKAQREALMDHRSFDGLKHKDLVGIPWRVAFALQADGWWLRSDIIWSKPNPMPESMRDRPTKAHEYVFLLTKSERYFYDADAIKEVSTWDPSKSKMPDGWDTGAGGHGSFHRNGREKGAKTADKQRGHSRRHAGFNDRWDLMPKDEQRGTANKRSVWSIATSPFPEAHFATFPPELPEICIKAGCPKGGTVLDPFSGAGTTALVADRLQRNAIGIELNPEYAAMSERRIDADRGGLLDAMEAAQ